MSIILTLLVIIFVLTLLLTIFHYATNGRHYWHRRNVPYREPCPIFGNFGATLTMRRSYTAMLHYFYESFHNEKYVGIFQARRPTLMLIDLELVKTVLSKKFSNFSDRISVATDTRREPLLRNLANMSGSEWKAMRHIVTPTFSSAKMKAMFPLIAECAQTLKQVLLNDSTDEVDVPALMSRFTTDVIGSCAFGVNPGSLANPESPFLKMSQRMFKTTRSAILKRYCRTFFPRLFKLLNLKTYPEDVEIFFSSMIVDVLSERRTSGKQRQDFLQLMLNVQLATRDSKQEIVMTDELITSNSFIFMLAGLESTATNMAFALYELAKDRDLQEKIRNEVLECLERHGGITYEAVSVMRLTTQAALETLRLHPSTPLTTRLCTSPCDLTPDLAVKLKENVLIPLSCIMRDEKHFSNPEKFDLDRFEGETHPPAFLAYGDGPRSCPGK